MTPEQIEIEGLLLVTPAGRQCDTCPQEALYFVEYRSLAAFCPVCFERRSVDFKARVAALVRSLLGGPVVGNGIIDDLRTMQAELQDEGY